MKHRNPEKLFFQHLHVEEKDNNPYKNTRLEKINRMRNGIIVDILTSVDIVEIHKCGGPALEFSKDFSVIS